MKKNGGKKMHVIGGGVVRQIYTSLLDKKEAACYAVFYNPGVLFCCKIPCDLRLREVLP